MALNMFPVFAREVLGERHIRRLRKDRLLVGAISGLSLVMLACVDRWSGGLSMGRILRVVPVDGLMPFLLVAIGVSIGTRLLATERREGTLPLLMLTRLSGRDILLGKLLAAMVMQADALLAIVPAAVLPMLMVGCGFEQTALTLLACANLVF